MISTTNAAEGGDATTTSEANDAQPAGAIDPCSLLTTSDIEAATGLAFDDGTFNEQLSSDSQVICDWIASEEFATVQTLIVPDDVFDSQRESAAEAFDVSDVSIAGADTAYATTEGSLIGMSVDGMFLQVAYIPTGPGEVLDATTQLATTAVANLGG